MHYKSFSYFIFHPLTLIYMRDIHQISYIFISSEKGSGNHSHLDVLTFYHSVGVKPWFSEFGNTSQFVTAGF